MGGWTGSEDARSLDALQLAVDHGCNFFDSAWAYGDGRSDTLLGMTLARNTDQRLYAASKIPPMNGKWPARAAYRYADVFPAKHVRTHVDLICKALRQDAIDLLQFHVWDDSWSDQKEFRETVESLRASGKIRAFGLSLNRWEPENGIQALRTGLVDTVQVIYNIFDQAPEDELFPVCEELGIGVIARVPLDEGSLGGKLARDTVFPANDWRARYFNPENLHVTLDRVEQLRALLPEGMSLAELALRFVISHPVVSTTIVGMRTQEHVRGNASYMTRGPLPADLLNELRRHRWDRRPQPWSD
jgi:aryl-alcohol dehydrogenase-like predicted oxidoreductase